MLARFVATLGSRRETEFRHQVPKREFGNQREVRCANKRSPDAEQCVRAHLHDVEGRCLKRAVNDLSNDGVATTVDEKRTGEVMPSRDHKRDLEAALLRPRYHGIAGDVNNIPLECITAGLWTEPRSQSLVRLEPVPGKNEDCACGRRRLNSVLGLSLSPSVLFASDRLTGRETALSKMSLPISYSPVAGKTNAKMAGIRKNSQNFLII